MQRIKYNLTEEIGIFGTRSQAEEQVDKCYISLVFLQINAWKQCSYSDRRHYESLRSFMSTFLRVQVCGHIQGVEVTNQIGSINVWVIFLNRFLSLKLINNMCIPAGLLALQSPRLHDFLSVEKLSVSDQIAFFLPMEINNRVFSAALLNQASEEYQSLYKEVSNVVRWIILIIMKNVHTVVFYRLQD